MFNSSNMKYNFTGTFHLGKRGEEGSPARSFSFFYNNLFCDLCESFLRYVFSSFKICERGENLKQVFKCFW